MLRLPRSLGPTVSRSSQICLRNGIGASGSLTLTACGPWFAVLNFLECRKKMQCKVHLTDQHFYFVFLSTSWPSHVPVCHFSISSLLFLQETGIYWDISCYGLKWKHPNRHVWSPISGACLCELVVWRLWEVRPGWWRQVTGARPLGVYCPFSPLLFPAPKNDWQFLHTLLPWCMSTFATNEQRQCLPPLSGFCLAFCQNRVRVINTLVIDSVNEQLFTNVEVSNIYIPGKPLQVFCLYSQGKHFPIM